MSYWERVAANLLPLSVEPTRLRVALGEWRYAGRTYDLERPTATCELCGKEQIRYQFEIVNRHNRNRLLIGSECIIRFEIRVLDDAGEVLDADSGVARVRADRHRLITEAKFKSVIGSLLQLAARDPEFEIESFIGYYRERRAFTPHQLSLLVWRFEEQGVPYHRPHFKLALRRERERAQLRSMEPWKFERLLPCMTKSQRDTAARLRGESGGGS